MRIICETEEELKRARNIVIKNMCNNVSDDECNEYDDCGECIENHSIYIQMDEED